MGGTLSLSPRRTGLRPSSTETLHGAWKYVLPGWLYLPRTHSGITAKPSTGLKVAARLRVWIGTIRRRGRALHAGRPGPAQLGPSGKEGSTGEPGVPPCREAERAGFEPATHLAARTRFPVALLRPLGHLSKRAKPSRYSVRPRRGGRAVECGGLENRYGPLGPSRVQIPPPPLNCPVFAFLRGIRLSTTDEVGRPGAADRRC